MSSIISSSSSRSIVGEREAKRLEKLFDQEAKEEQAVLQHALKDIKVHEKALKKVHKETEKAQKEASKAKEEEYAAAKVLNKAKHKHADALDKETKAEEDLTKRRAYEKETDGNARQSFSDLEDYQRVMVVNAKDRDTRLAGLRADFEHTSTQGGDPLANATTRSQ